MEKKYFLCSRPSTPSCLSAAVVLRLPAKQSKSNSQFTVLIYYRGSQILITWWGLLIAK